MTKDPLRSHDMYFNRELSWLEFNDRVLRQGLADDLPLLERIKFLAIVSSNLDEFFLVRVAGLMSARAEGVRRRDPSGMTPAAQLQAVSQRMHRMMQEQQEGVLAALGQLAAAGISVVPAAQWTEEQRKFLPRISARRSCPCSRRWPCRNCIRRRGCPGCNGTSPCAWRRPRASERIAVTPVPQQISRWVRLPGEDVRLARLEDVIAANVGLLFPGARIAATALFRITRDADVSIERDETDDLLEAVEQAVLTRQRRPPVRLQVSPAADPRIRAWLDELVKLQPEEVYEMDSTLDGAALMELANWPGFEQLKNVDWPPQPPRDLLGSDDLFETLADHDVLLFHPYETFEPVVRLIEQAADDPNVLAIKQTLYRTSGNSPIVRALGRAAQSGKEVTVLVELRARFDEARNIQWARRLEDLGAHVIYGIAGYKTHAKALLIVRRPGQSHPALRPPGHGQLQRPHGKALQRLRPDDDRPRHRQRRGRLLQSAHRLLGDRRLVEAGDRPHGPATQVPRPHRARDPGLDARPAGADHGQGEFAGGPRDLPGPVSRQPGRREDPAERARDLRAAARRGRRFREYRGAFHRRSLPGARPRVLLPQRRA